jgi:hypothetical protein
MFPRRGRLGDGPDGRGDDPLEAVRRRHQAPTRATLVVFHSAVLGYLPSRRDVDHFAHRPRAQAVHLAQQRGRLGPPRSSAPRDRPTTGRFVLSGDGTPVALTGPHGQSIEWLGNGTVAEALEQAAAGRRRARRGGEPR